jgi:integrase/recombinase XerD
MVQEARTVLALEQQRPRPRPRHLRSARLGLNLILWAYFSGCRVAEIANTRWEDLHPRVDGDYNLTVLGKGSKRRTVPMPRQVVEEVVERASQGRTGRVFPVGPRRVQTITKSLAHRAGLETGVSPHWLRHAHASHAVDGGAPLHVVQRTLGHASLGTTGRYLHRRQDGSAKYLVAL